MYILILMYVYLDWLDIILLLYRLLVGTLERHLGAASNELLRLGAFNLRHVTLLSGVLRRLDHCGPRILDS